MKKKVLMWRESGDIDWIEYNDDTKPKDIDSYELGRIYTYEYKVIEVDTE